MGPVGPVLADKRIGGKLSKAQKRANAKTLTAMTKLVAGKAPPPPSAKVGSKTKSASSGGMNGHWITRNGVHIFVHDAPPAHRRYF